MRCASDSAAGGEPMSTSGTACVEGARRALGHLPRALRIPAGGSNLERCVSAASSPRGLFASAPYSFVTMTTTKEWPEDEHPMSTRA